MDNLAIDIKKLTKEFLIDKNKSIPVLNGITLSAYYGEFISILGISGSGKTTLLNCMSSLSRPTEGEVRINGKDPYKLKNRQLAKIRREEISFIFQSYNLVPSLPVFENIVLPLRLSNKRVNKDKVVELLSKLRFNADLSSLVGNLSGGEQQKVAICRAILSDSKIIFADEPTGA
ncbi:MAG: ATP-binding cassette domain-containing protein, partial [Streptococcus salivarius]|nr:ATP-binding cassette domain-containing protein [Streptococcus salivarius]